MYKHAPDLINLSRKKPKPKPQQTDKPPGKFPSPGGIWLTLRSPRMPVARGASRLKFVYEVSQREDCFKKRFPGKNPV